MLRRGLSQAEFAGVLRGVALAEAYAYMDILGFPSHRDTFGNVVLEAFASGVPAVVSNAGGPKFIVRHGESGFVAQTDAGFIAYTARLLRCAELRATMSRAACAQACGESWDDVFGKVYESYQYIRAQKCFVKS